MIAFYYNNIKKKVQILFNMTHLGIFLNKNSNIVAFNLQNKTTSADINDTPDHAIKYTNKWVFKAYHMVR